jgi:hypothetical protein
MTGDNSSYRTAQTRVSFHHLYIAIDLCKRLKIKLPISPEFTALVTGHGKRKAYLYRFKLTDRPTCLSNEGAQTPEHLIYTCTLLASERSSLDKHITAGGGSWPTTNNELVTTHIDAFTRFVKSIDFNKLQ